MDRFELETELINELGLKVGVELGVEAGRNSRHLLETTKLEHLYMIDLWTKNPTPEEPINILNYDDSFRRAMRTALRYKERTSIIRDDTIKAADFFKKDSVDFLFIDADQRFEGMYNNFVTWFPKCRSGALMCIRNYHHKHSYAGAREAIEKVSKEYDLPFKLTDDKYNTAFFVKEGEY